MKRIIGLAVACVSAWAGAQEAAFRAPAVPLITVDTMFSVWSPATRLTEADTVNWALKDQPIDAWLDVDAASYRVIGTRDWRNPVLPQTKTRVRATQTICEFENKDLTATLTFSTPFLAENLNVFSRPVTYLTIRYAYKDGRARKTAFRFAWNGQMVAKSDGAAVEMQEGQAIFGKYVKIGQKTQKPLEERGDRVRPNWGYAWIVAPQGGTVGQAPWMEGRGEGVALSVKPMMTIDFGSAARGEKFLVLAYDDVKSVTFMGKECPAWWRRAGADFNDMLAEAVRDYPALMKQMKAFDDRFEQAMTRVGGEKYARLTELAYRQSFAACKLVADADGAPLYFSKEHSSGGFMGTVDVFYPQSPLLLLTSKTLMEATLRPIMRYVASGKWEYSFAPHDVGRYPNGSGQEYRMNKEKYPNDSDRMPVEECGNMLVLFGALAHFHADAAFAAEWKSTLKQWAAYLEKVGYDPDDQLCTDDFAGHLAHNTNLGLKSIMALRAYADLAESWGERDEAARIKALLGTWVTQWVAAAKGGAAGGYRLAFDRPDTWSLKYNLAWDRALGYNLFPKEVAAAELKAYRALQHPYGMTLDNRTTYTKADWIFWAATLTGERADLDALVAPFYRYANETPDRAPLTDWYWADTGRLRGFIARSVIGGLFMPALVEQK